MQDYEQPKGRGNKKSDKARKNFEMNGKNTKRGIRHIESILEKSKSISKK